MDPITCIMRCEESASNTKKYHNSIKQTNKQKIILWLAGIFLANSVFIVVNYGCNICGSEIMFKQS